MTSLLGLYCLVVVITHAIKRLDKSTFITNLTNLIILIIHNIMLRYYNYWSDSKYMSFAFCIIGCGLFIYLVYSNLRYIYKTIYRIQFDKNELLSN
jgi:hypothetical protein